MPEIKIINNNVKSFFIDVWCGTCGRGLCENTIVDNRKPSFTIEACPDCMAEKETRIKKLEEKIEELKILMR